MYFSLEQWNVLYELDWLTEAMEDWCAWYMYTNLKSKK